MTSLRKQTGGFAIPLGLFVAIGVALWGWNAWRLLRGRATPAVVVSSGVGTSRGRDGATYYPRVGFRYQVAGATYDGIRVFAGSGESRGRDWAEDVASRFTVGDSTIAYVDPSDPAAAYLVGQPSAGPLLLVALPLAVIGLLAFEGRGKSADATTPDAVAAARTVRSWHGVALAVVGAHLALVVVCAATAGSVALTIATLWRATIGDGFFVVSAGALVGMAYYLARRARATAP